MNINNPKIWCLTDGSQGMISQTRGLAYELSNDVKEIKTDIIFPWSNLQPGFLPFYGWIFKNKIPKDNFPDVVISCGRKSVYFSLYLKRIFSRIVNIHIQNPKISSKNFSFIIAPNHDNFTGDKIINSVGAIHHFKFHNLKKNELEIKNEEIVSCMIGGENNHYFFRENEAADLCEKIIKLKEKNSNYKFLIITSRRTNETIKNIIKIKIGSFAKIWLGDGDNPYEFAIYNSKFFIITSDSTSMISEASISGMPIYIYNLPLKRKSIRFIRFHEEFKNLNITKDLPNTNLLEPWSYDKLNESKRIAGIIKERIIERTNES